LNNQFHDDDDDDDYDDDDDDDLERTTVNMLMHTYVVVADANILTKKVIMIFTNLSNSNAVNVNNHILSKMMTERNHCQYSKERSCV